jgi:hypothetical protein
VRDEHVQDRAGGVVELRPVADAERLGHVDLHRLDVLAVPVRGGRAVSEAEHVQILGGFLAQEMVDPVHLLLIQDRMNDPVEFAEAAGRGAKGLLVDDPGAAGQSVLPQRLGQPAEGDRRDGQVVHQLRAGAERCARLAEHVRQAARAARAEPAAGEEHALRE